MNNLGSKYITYSSVAGLFSALLFIGIFVFGSLFMRQTFAMISPIALAVAGLSMGMNALLIACAVAIAVVMVAMPSAVIIYFIIDVLPLVLMTYLFIRVYVNKEKPVNLSIGSILSIMSVIATILMIGFLGLFPFEIIAEELGVSAGSLKEFFFMNFSAQLPKPEGVDASDWNAVIETITGYFPSALFVTWLFRIVVVMVLAQWIVSRKDKMLRATPNYSALEIPSWAIFPVIGLAVGAFVSGGDLRYILENALIVSATPFLCLGMAQVHLFARKFNAFGFFILVVFYIVFFSGYAYAMLLVSLLGIFEFIINQKLIKDKILKE